MFSNTYMYLKAVHLIAAFPWLAGLFYLPRLYMHHAQAGAGSPQAETFKIMERRLSKAIMTPAMLITVGVGAWIAFAAHGPDWWLTAGWLHAKIALAALLLVFHFFLVKWGKDFEAGRIPHSSRFFRMINEAPTVLLIGIVILAVVQPF
jgi:protoporphyrinogen IX oxidase